MKAVRHLPLHSAVWRVSQLLLCLGLVGGGNALLSDDSVTLQSTTADRGVMYAAVVTNLTVSPQLFPTDGSTELQLNVSWTPPVDGRFPNEYTLMVIPLEDTDCPDTRCSDVIVPKNASSWLVPQTISSVHEAECSIVPGCRYAVNVTSHPFNGYDAASAIYQVPECVGVVCSCRHWRHIPAPLVSARQVGEHGVNVTWSLDMEDNVDSNHHFVVRLSEQKVFFVPVKDQIIVPIRPNVREYYKLIHARLTPGSKYIAKVYVADDKGCRGNSSNATITVPFFIHGEPKQTKKDKTWSIDTVLPVASFLLVAALIVAVSVQRAGAWFRRKSRQSAPEPLRVHWSRHSDEYKTRMELVMGPNFQMEINPDYVEKEKAERLLSSDTDSLEISIDRLIFGVEIGKGAFGRVYRATAEAIYGAPGRQTVAVKKLGRNASSADVDDFLQEICTLKKVGRHPNVVTLLGCCTVSHPLCIVMEYIPCGDLLRYLRTLRTFYESRTASPGVLEVSRRSSANVHRGLTGKYIEIMQSSSSDGSYIQPENGPLTRPSVTETEYTMLEGLSCPTTPMLCPPSPMSPLRQEFPGFGSSKTTLEYVLDPKELQNFALQIARGMAHLEQKQITHMDLAARNILIDENKTLKISDFGMSRSGIYVRTRHKMVPLRWLALESMRDNLYSSKSDVWAFAVVLWEIGTLGGFPYPTISNHELQGHLQKGGRLGRPDNISVELYSIMEDCWRSSQDDRPTFKELVDVLQAAKHKVYVDFSALNPNYVFPPIEEKGDAHKQ